MYQCFIQQTKIEKLISSHFRTVPNLMKDKHIRHNFTCFKKKKKKKGYCGESEVGAPHLALSGMDVISCEALETACLSCSWLRSPSWQPLVNSSAIWSTILLSSRQSTSNLRKIAWDCNLGSRLTHFILKLNWRNTY